MEARLALLVDLAYLNILIVDSLDYFIPLMSDLLNEFDVSALSALYQSICPRLGSFARIATEVMRLVESRIETGKTRATSVNDIISGGGPRLSLVALLRASSIHLLLKSLLLLLLLEYQLLLLMLVFCLLLLSMINLRLIGD